jgi:hypothetical protein
LINNVSPLFLHPDRTLGRDRDHCDPHGRRGSHPESGTASDAGTGFEQGL